MKKKKSFTGWTGNRILIDDLPKQKVVNGFWLYRSKQDGADNWVKVRITIEEIEEIEEI